MPTKTNAIEPTYSTEEILAQVKKISSADSFQESDILKRFLLFIVRETLEGRSNRLKEYTIAINVLKKPLNFKPQENGIVRIHAGRLRRALGQYYEDKGSGDAIRISVPIGSYVPLFTSLNEDQLNHVILETETGLNTFLINGNPSKNFVLSVLPFRYADNQKLQSSFADNMGYELTSALQHLNHFSVIAFQVVKNISEKSGDLREVIATLGSQFFITGGIQAFKDRIRVSIELVQAGTFEQVWSEHFEKRVSESNIYEMQDEIIKSALEELNILLMPGLDNPNSGNMMAAV